MRSQMLFNWMKLFLQSPGGKMVPRFLSLSFFLKDQKFETFKRNVSILAEHWGVFHKGVWTPYYFDAYFFKRTKHFFPE